MANILVHRSVQISSCIFYKPWDFLKILKTINMWACYIAKKKVANHRCKRLQRFCKAFVVYYRGRSKIQEFYAILVYLDQNETDFSIVSRTLRLLGRYLFYTRSDLSVMRTYYIFLGYWKNEEFICFVLCRGICISFHIFLPSLLACCVVLTSLFEKPVITLTHTRTEDVRKKLSTHTIPSGQAEKLNRGSWILR